MDTYHLMVYGGGNSEIAASLEEAMNMLYNLKNRQLKLYAKTYIMASSGFEMYKRFNTFKEEAQQVKSGGVYEYTYLGEEEGVTCQELSMGAYATPQAFKEFLRQGIDRLQAKEVILLLIGQSFGNGLLLDFCHHEPMQLSYKALAKGLAQVGREKGVYFHLVLDVPTWHKVQLPYALSQVASVASLFIYEREELLQILPISNWLSESLEQCDNPLYALYRNYHGYRIQTHAMWWRLCRYHWKAYCEAPSVYTWRGFYEAYRYLIHYIGLQATNLSMKALRLDMTMPTTTLLQQQQLMHYFQDGYGEALSEDELGQWLGDMKNCVSYYKM